MATLSRIRVHPIKALDPVEPDSARISGVGGLAGDRSFAIVDSEGNYVNGKRTAAVHRLRSSVDLDEGVVDIGVRDGAGAGPEPGELPSGDARFDLDADRDAFAEWLSDFFGYEVTVEAAPGGDLADSRVYGDIVAGATVVSTATLQEVASWYPDLDVENVRRRFRANLEVEGVEPFWEDRLVGSGTSDDDASSDEGPGGEGPEVGKSERAESAGGRRFRIGDVTFEGVTPITRCVVPTRDPYTGVATDGFRERFTERREETFPREADRNSFDHFYALTTLAHPDEADWNESLGVGDRVEVLD